MEASDNTTDSPIPMNRARMNSNRGVRSSQLDGSNVPTANCFGLRQATQIDMTAFTTETAVNMEIAIPSAIVTAKPRTGPEPTMNSNVVAISAVTFESTIVA